MSANIVLIAAMDSNGIIGIDGEIPWHDPKDLKWFRECTLDRAVIVGRKTAESIKGILRDRRVFVITSNPNSVPIEYIPVPGPYFADFKRVLDEEEEVFIAGGEEVYKAYLPIADEILLTHYLSLDCREMEGEDFTYFPWFLGDDRNGWATKLLSLEMRGDLGEVAVFQHHRPRQPHPWLTGRTQ